MGPEAGAGKGPGLGSLARGLPGGLAASSADTLTSSTSSSSGGSNGGDDEWFHVPSVTGAGSDDDEARASSSSSYPLQTNITPEPAAVALMRLPQLQGVPAVGAADSRLAAPSAAALAAAAAAGGGAVGGEEGTPSAGSTATGLSAAAGSSSPLSPTPFPITTPAGRCILNSPLLLRRAAAALPALFAASTWRLVFSLRAGADLAGLYRAAAATAPLLLLVRDHTGAVAAAYFPEPLRPKPGFAGSARGWVAQLWPKYAVYRQSGLNRFFVQASRGYLAVGGGENHALWVDEGLRAVASGKCETFNSPRITGAETAVVHQLELWGFVPPGARA